MEEFYETLTDFMPHDHKCPECGEESLWTEYGDGHMCNICLKCEYPTDLSPAPYVTRQPVPTGPLPEHIEVLERRRQPWQLEHEARYYRRRRYPKSDWRREGF